MKNQLLRFTLSAIIIYLTGGTLNPAVAATQLSVGNGTHVCGVDDQWDKRHSDQYPNRRYARTLAANLNVGEPRTMRMIYFLPNDRPYRVEVVQRMKHEILDIQTFFAEQMDAHGYGKLTFRFETDSQGEPIVHRVDGGHPDSYYLYNPDPMFDEIEQAFDLDANIYLIVIDNSVQPVTENATGIGGPRGRSGGFALVNEEFSRESAGNLATHELGHAFGLGHDFRDGAYILSYGSGASIGPWWSQLSACHAEKLSVHPYFNPNTPIEEEQLPTIEFISSPQYPAGSKSVLIQLEASDSEGLHQVLLSGSDGLIACRGLAGEKDVLIEFNYDGAFTAEGFTNLSDSMIHPIHVEAVDTNGNVGHASFELVEISPHHIATFEDHTAGVNSVAFSLVDATLLAAGSRDGTVKLWDVVTQQDIATFRHTSGVHSVSFSSDGAILATGSWDGTVKLWDVTTQQDIATLKVYTEGITSVAFSSDEVTLATGSHDGTVKLWDVETERDIATFRHTSGVHSVSFSSDGAILATGSWDRTVKLWDVATRQNIATFEEHTAEVNSVVFSPVDPTLLATGSSDSTVKLWDVEMQQDIATLEGHTSGISSVVFSSDGSTLASGSWDRTVKLWDITTRVNFATLGHGDQVLSVSFSSDDTTLASGTGAGTVELWDTSGLMGVRLEATAEIDIPDPNLRAAIAEAIGVPPSAPIFRGNMTTLTHFSQGRAKISNLTGLEGATNLRRLYLWGNNVSDISAVSGLTNLRELGVDNNSISDISAVSGLTNLTYLNLGGNSVSDISAVSGLTNLTVLYLGNNVSDISAVSGLTNLRELNVDNNSISDISAVSGLTNLRILYLGGNSVSDISVVSGLTNLTWLNLAGNSVSDISVVSGLTNLTWLNLAGNSVSDISAVAGLTDLTELNVDDNAISDVSPLLGLNLTGTSRDSTGLYLERNPLSYVSINTHIPAIQAKGVEVKFDSRTVTTLLNISGVITASDNVLTVEVRDSNGRIFEGVPVTFAVISGGGTLSVTNTTTDKKGRAQSTLTLGKESNRVTVSTVGAEQTATFSDVAEAGVHIPDPNLRAAIEDVLGVKSGSPISPEEMATLTYLRAREASIGVLIGLEFATNLTELRLGNNGITDISPLSGLTNLRTLGLSNNGIKDVSALVSVLSGLINLTNLHLSYNQVTNISSLSGLTHLTELRLSGNRITDISPLSGLTNLRTLDLPSGITDLPALVRVLSRLTHLTSLNLSDNNIGDASVLIPVLSDLTDLIDLNLSGSGITDLSPLAELTNLTNLHLWNNNISDISAVADLIHLTNLSLGNNSISDISAVAGLTNLTSLNLWNNNISDLSPLVSNTGLGSGDWSWINVRENPLSYQSIHTHIPTLQSRGVTVDSDNQAHPTLLKISGENQRRLPGETLAYPFVVEARDENGSPFAGVSVTFAVTGGGGTLSIHTTTTDANGRAESTLTLGPNFGTNTVFVSAAGIPVSLTFHAIGDNPEFLWSIPSGYSLIHVPLRVTAVDDVPMTIRSIADLYDALGGADTVTYLLTLDSQTQEWFGYFRPSDRDTPADRGLTDDMGILARLITPVSVRLTGGPLGTNGTSTITLNPDINLVGLPLRNSRLTHVSDLFTLEGIGGNIPAIIFTDNGEFKGVIPAGGPGDIPIIGGQAFMLDAQQMATVAISGAGWYNTSETAAAPLLSLKGVEVGDTTPVLGLRGSIVDEDMGTNSAGFRVIVKNLSTGRAVATVTKDENYSRPDKQKSERVGYQVVIVDVETGRAAQIGDILEISVRSPDPLIGVQPLRYTVTAEDVKRGLIQLTELVAYEIPTETELLHNYPNPFNPETWIPYRLAEDAFVTLTIYDLNGHVVRTFDVGHQIASVYESRSKAVYWDGRNGVGEQVASGVYFYTLTGGDYFATRKMVILK